MKELFLHFFSTKKPKAIQYIQHLKPDDPFQFYKYSNISKSLFVCGFSKSIRKIAQIIYLRIPTLTQIYFLPTQ